MKIRLLDRYVSQAVAFGTLTTLSVLLALFVLFAFMDEVGDIGKGAYGVVEALQYVLLRMPGLIYQLFPVSALLGAMLGLGTLASNSELVIMRASGVSLLRITWSVMKVGLMLMAFAIVLGEAVAPVSERYAERMRAVAISTEIVMQNGEGIWARDGLDFINIKNTYANGRIGDVYIFELNDSSRLDRLIVAKEALFQAGRWILKDVQFSRFEATRVNVTHQDRFEWSSSLTPELLGVVAVKPESLTIWGLYQYIDYLQNNGLSSERYELAFWTKALAPLVMVVMVFLAVPFVFGPLRSVGVGHRILVGSLVGISFHLANQIVNYAGLVYALSPALSAAVAPVVFLALAVWLLRRVY